MNLNLSSTQNHLFLKILSISIFLINSAFSDESIEKLKPNATLSKLQDTIYHSEKVFLHFDKPYYSSGDHMWFKVYLVSANSNRPDAISKIVHVELINPSNKIVISRMIKIENGGGEGEFYLPKRLYPGEYTLRAYTNFMRNFDESYFFLKRIHIGSSSSLATKKTSLIINTAKKKKKESPATIKPDIQFFPEGGYLVNDQTSQIGIKAIDIYGKSIDISGSILDNDQNEIVTFSTLTFGLGMVRFTPKQDKSYKALVNYKGKNYTYDLPKALAKGVTMRVVNRKDSYQIHIQSSLPKGVHHLILTGLQNGSIVNIAELTGTKKRGIVKVPKATLRQGIAQFTIFDETEKPLCERLVFVETKGSEPRVNIMPAHTEYQKRELITIDFEADPITQANMSLAVTDISVVDPDEYGLDIRSHFLLNSELKGEIEQPGYYFQTKDPNRKKLLDLLMMTQGWRQFLWNHADKREDKKKYAHETGIYFKGIVKKTFNHKKTANAEVSLTFKNANEFGHDETTTFNNGNFTFGDYHFNDSTSIIIQAKKYKIDKKTNQKKIKNPNTNYSIALEAYVSPTITSKQEYLDEPDYVGPSSNQPINYDYITRPKMKITENTVSPFEGDFEQLEEVKLTYTRIKEKEKFKNRYTIYGNPTYRIDFDEINTFGTNSVLAALQDKVPGLRIRGDVNAPMSWIVDDVEQSNYGISIRGGLGRPPLILLNNMEVQDLSTILAADVSFVDVLTPTRAAIYGSRAMGGVISIHTKRGNEYQNSEKKERRGIINFIHPGYYKARKFYEPVYKVKKPEHKNFDYRSTLYWNPTLNFDEKGKARISFYAADISTTYRIELQGISLDGFPIKNEIYVDVE